MITQVIFYILKSHLYKYQINSPMYPSVNQSWHLKKNDFEKMSNNYSFNEIPVIENI